MPFFLRILACFYSLWVEGGQNEIIWFKKIWFHMAQKKEEMQGPPGLPTSYARDSQPGLGRRKGRGL